MATTYKQGYINDFGTTVAAGHNYTAGGTSLYITSFTGPNGLALPTDGSVFYLQVDSEYFLVTGCTGSNPLTVVGAQAGSTAANHTAGANVTGCWVLPPVLDGLRYDHLNILGDKLFGTKGGYKLEYQSVAAGASVDILPTLTASGYVDSIAVFFAASSATITITVDGEVTPSINGVDLATFMWQARSNNVLFSPWFIYNGGGPPNSATYIPIPFGTSIRIQVTNTGATTQDIFSMVTYQTGIPNIWPYTQKLFVSSGKISGATPNQVCTLLNYSGGKRGRLFGMLWSMDTTSASSDVAPLEGNFKFYVDGAGSPNVESSGAEDWFFMSGYFGGVGAIPTLVGDTIGVIAFKQNLAGGAIGSGHNTSAYRIHTKDPMVWNTGMKVTWNAGDTSEANWTGTLDVYYCIFYYLEN